MNIPSFTPLSTPRFSGIYTLKGETEANQSLINLGFESGQAKRPLYERLIEHESETNNIPAEEEIRASLNLVNDQLIGLTAPEVDEFISLRQANPTEDLTVSLEAYLVDKTPQELLIKPPIDLLPAHIRNAFLSNK